jgi:hypothetical protein
MARAGLIGIGLHAEARCAGEKIERHPGDRKLDGHHAIQLFLAASAKSRRMLL